MSAEIKEYKQIHTPLQNYKKYYGGNGNVIKTSNNRPLRRAYSNPYPADVHRKFEIERTLFQLSNSFYESFINSENQFDSISKPFIFQNFKFTINQLLENNPDFITYSILKEEQSIFLQSRKNGINIYLEIFFTKTENENEIVEAVTNLYKENNCIFAFEGTVKETIDKINFKTKDGDTIISTGTQSIKLPSILNSEIQL